MTDDLIAVGVSMFLCALSVDLARYLRGSPADGAEDSTPDLLRQVQAPLYIVLGGLAGVAVFSS